VGSRAPAQAQYARASWWETCTTGWSARSSRSEPGPSDALQLAPRRPATRAPRRPPRTRPPARGGAATGGTRTNCRTAPPPSHIRSPARSPRTRRW
jgi:hypothetical protein